MANWKAGDTVRLKSKGPVMTVDGNGATGYVICVWFHEKERREGVFAAAALEAVNMTSDD